MTGRLEGKVAVVTGGASGIGLAVVERFVAEGARVVFCDLTPRGGQEANDRAGGAMHHARREAGGANDGAAIAARLGERVRFVPADVTSEEQLGAVFRTATEAFGGLDIVVNNAGIGTAEGPLAHVPPGVFQRVMDVNVRGVWNGMRAAIPLLEARGGGSIVNLSSILGLRAWPNQSTYCATKGALLAMSRAAALELAPSRVRVNCVAPGIMLTPIYYDSPSGLPVDRDRLAEHFARQQPIPRAGSADDVASAILFLASDDSSFVTGQTLVVDGGLDARVFSDTSYGDFMGGLLQLMTPG
ncbi:MAG: SDR family oxidoreductase [Deltaproteobacteria bacterium]|nr:SDR family oxidoreductase [Deltaproteobacteria bacterium]